MQMWTQNEAKKDANLDGENDVKLDTKKMQNWMKKLGLTLKISELGATYDMLDGIANATFILNGGYKVLNHDEVVKILKESM